MTWWVAAVWAAGGVFLLEALVIASAIKVVKKPPWKVPGEVGLAVLILSVILRMAAGSILVGGLAASGDICNAGQAMFSGAATPVLLIEKLGALIKGAS